MDKATKVIEGVGEVGIDTEASEGNGRYYAKLYNGDYDACGFYTESEAMEELMYAVEFMSDMDE